MGTPIFCIISILVRIDLHYLVLENWANVYCIPPHSKIVEIMKSLHIDYEELRNDENFLLKISLVFCHLDINSFSYIIKQGEQANNMSCIDDVMR